MTDAEKGKRVAELLKKQSAGTITKAELDELKALLASAPENQVGATKIPTAADFEAAKAAAAKAETERQKAAAAEKAAAAGGSGPDLVAASATVPAVKPEDMKVNPALTLPGYGTTPSGEPVKLPPAGQTGAENPALYPTKSEDTKPVSDATAPAKKAEPVDEFAAARAAGADTVPDVSEKKVPEEKKEPTFGEKMKKLAVDWGVPILDLIQGGASGYVGSTKETALDKRLAEKSKQSERDFMAHLQDLQDQKAEARAQKQMDFQAQQAELDRIADKQARGEELSTREKIAQMSAAAAKASAGAKSYIPD